jgi:tetratricopeptide (TPR) repeat protein
MRLAYVVLFAAMFVTSAQAQPNGFPDPIRPKLVATADTNDSRAYASLARASRKPADAYAAFVWAHRLRPTRLDYLSEMVDALIAGQSQRWLRRYVSGHPEVRDSPLARQADSIRRVIVLRDPFFGLPPAKGSCSATPVRDLAAEQLVERGFYALQTGCYYRAIAYLEEAAQRDSMLEHLLHLRAVAWHMVRRPAEAATDLQRAIVGVRRLQAQSIEQSLYSTAMLEYVLGMMHMRIGDAVSARGAFERALSEDLSFHTAHVRLGELAMGKGDLNAAIDAFSMATQIRPDDAFALGAYANALTAAKRYDEARAAYEQAIGLVPHYADYRFALAELLDRAGDAPSAVRAYRDYVGRAARHDSLQIQFATDRISTMESARNP